MTTEEKLKSWEEFGESIKPLIPVLIGQLQGVVEETERAAANLIERFQVISHKVLSDKDTQSPHAATELAKDIAQIVMYIQFQDITRQKVEHVYGPLEQILDHVAALTMMEGDEDAQQGTLKKLKNFSEIYTMASERILMQEIQHGRHRDGHESMAASNQQEEAPVTLF